MLFLSTEIETSIKQADLDNNLLPSAVPFITITMNSDYVRCQLRWLATLLPAVLRQPYFLPILATATQASTVRSDERLSKS